MGLKSWNVLIYVLLFMSSTKILPFLAVLSWFLNLGKIPITDLQHRHHPQNIPHLVKKIKGFPLKVKSFWNSATFQKLWGRVPFIPLPCTTVGVWICVYVRVEEAYIKKAPFILLTLKISCIFYFHWSFQTVLMHFN